MEKPHSSQKIPKYIVLEPERGLIFQHGDLQQSRFQFLNITQLASLWACSLIRRLSKHFKAEQLPGHPSPVAVPARSQATPSPRQAGSPRAPAWVLIMQIEMDVSHCAVNSLAPCSATALSMKPIKGTSPCRTGKTTPFLQVPLLLGCLGDPVLPHPSLSRPPETSESLHWPRDLRRSLPSLPVQCTLTLPHASMVKNVGFAA